MPSKIHIRSVRDGLAFFESPIPASRHPLVILTGEMAIPVHHGFPLHHGSDVAGARVEGVSGVLVVRPEELKPVKNAAADAQSLAALAFPARTNLITT